MKKVHASNRERDKKDQPDEPSDDELDERPFVFFGLGFQLAELRYGVPEVNLGRARSLDSRLSRGREHEQKLRRPPQRPSAKERDVFALPLRPKYAK